MTHFELRTQLVETIYQKYLGLKKNNDEQATLLTDAIRETLASSTNQYNYKQIENEKNLRSDEYYDTIIDIPGHSNYWNMNAVTADSVWSFWQAYIIF